LVSGPLNKGDTLVIEGVQRLRAGQELSFNLPLQDSQE